MAVGRKKKEKSPETIQRNDGCKFFQIRKQKWTS